MPVHTKQNVPDDRQSPKTVSAGAAPLSSGGVKGDESIGTRTGKEQDAIYKEEGQLLDEVKEKYKEADLEAQKQVEQALGNETKVKAEAKISPDVREVGVTSHDEDASDVLKKGGTIKIPVSQDVFEKGQSTRLGGKRLINRNIVGVSSLAALAIFVGRLLKMAHKHVRKVIFRKSGSEKDKVLEGADDAN